MGTEYVPAQIGSGVGQQSRLNAEFEAIEEALSKTLSREGGGDNAMEAPLDLGGNQILNLPVPNTPTSPVRVMDLESLAALPAEVGAVFTNKENGSIAEFQGGVLVDTPAQTVLNRVFTNKENGSIVEFQGGVLVATPAQTVLNREDVFVEGTNLVFQVPSDYATLQQAIDDLSVRITRQGVTITLNIETGHAPESGISVSNGDYSHFIISSEDAEVSLHASFTGDFIRSINGSAPTLNCLVDAGGLGQDGYYVRNGNGVVSTGCGVKNVGRNGCSAASGGIIHADGSNFSGAGTSGYTANGSGAAISAIESVADGCVRQGYQATLGATIIFRDGSADNCATAGGSSAAVLIDTGSRGSGRRVSALNSGGDGVWCDNGSAVDVRDGEFSGAAGFGVRAARNCTVHAQAATASNCLRGINATIGSRVNAHEIIIDGSTELGVFAANGSSVNLQSATITESGGDGIQADRLSQVNAYGATVTGSEGLDIRITSGSQVNIGGGTTSNGTPVVGDTNVSEFNEISNLGIIWA